MTKHEYLVSPGRGDGVGGSVRVPEAVWSALYRLACANGAPDLGGRYPPFDALLFVRAVREGMSAPPPASRVARPHVPDDFRPTSPAEVLRQEGHLPLVEALLDLMAAGAGFAVERVLAAGLRALPARRTD